MAKIGVSGLNSLLVKIESENPTPVHKSCSWDISITSGQWTLFTSREMGNTI